MESHKDASKVDNDLHPTDREDAVIEEDDRDFGGELDGAVEEFV